MNDVPSISDEAEAAWREWADERPGVTQSNTGILLSHSAFLAGFRAARQEEA